jgi:hypothetical protein
MQFGNRLLVKKILAESALLSEMARFLRSGRDVPQVESGKGGQEQFNGIIKAVEIPHFLLIKLTSLSFRFS